MSVQETKDPMTFSTPYECIATWCSKKNRLPYFDGDRRYREGERQRYCERCRLWRFADEECNLFQLGTHRA